MQKNLIEPFSDSYYISRLKVHEYNGEEAIMSPDLHDFFLQYCNPVIAKVGNSHYWIMRDSAVPSRTVAVPERTGDNVETDVLIATPKGATAIIGHSLFNYAQLFDNDEDLEEWD